MSVVKNYKVDNSVFGAAQVIEVPTQQVMSTFDNTRDAKVAANFWNGGNGFNGFTPSFLFGKLIVNN